ncbi:MAG TPA: hypothetical protein VJH03_26625 [Blastocatellia bacterium]|nr:hypothetical protein [Blastocatellia bacterium]
MKLALICLIVVGLFIEGGDATVRIKAGNSALPEGTTVQVSVDGDGCDCKTGSVSGRTDGRGYVTLVIRAACGAIDTTRCRAIARAEVGSGSSKTIYRGNAKLTQTAGGPYVSTVIVVP